MKTNVEILNNYLGLLKNLSSEMKAELIKQLSLSLKKEKDGKEKKFGRSYGAWESKKPASQIIEEIRSSRYFKRQSESL